MGKNQLKSKNNPIYKKAKNDSSMKSKKKPKPVKTNLKKVSIFFRN